MFKSIIAVAALVACSVAWSATTNDTNWILDWCEHEEPALNLTCEVYYRGAVDMARFVYIVEDVDPSYCLPDNFNTEIGVKIWRRYVEENPK